LANRLITSAGHAHAISKAHLRGKRKASALTGRLHMGSLQKIDHIVVLMLENRSFDSLLGTLYPKSDSFEG
jgi:phospholipase C